MSQSQEQKIIDIRVKILKDNDARKVLESQFKGASKAVLKTENDIKKVQDRIALSKTPGGTKTQKAKLSKLNKLLADQYTRYDRLSKKLPGVAKAQQKVYTSNQKLKRSLKGPEFQGWALSIMFAGMAIKKIFMSIGKSGVSTFKEIMSTQEGVTTSIDKLSGAWKYLQFTIGDAINQSLTPLLPFLFKIIDFVTAFIANHPTLIANIIGVGVAMGTLMTAGGGLALLIGGLESLSVKMSNMNFSDFKNRGMNALTSLAKVAAIAVSFYYAKEAFKAFKDGKWVSGLANVLIASGAALFGIGAVTLGTAGAIIALGVALKFISDPVFAESATKFMLSILDLMTAMVYAVFASWGKAFASMLKEMVSSIKSLLKGDFTNAIKTAMDVYKSKKTMGMDRVFSGNTGYWQEVKKQYQRMSSGQEDFVKGIGDFVRDLDLDGVQAKQKEKESAQFSDEYERFLSGVPGTTYNIEHLNMETSERNFQDMLDELNRNTTGGTSSRYN